MIDTFSRTTNRPVHIRASNGTHSKASTTIVGYGAVFYDPSDKGTEYQIGKNTYERIMPGAFDKTLQEDDAVCCFNHDLNFPLGRLSTGTLRLSVDDVGLRYETDAPENPTRSDLILDPIRRGTVQGSSFMFSPTDTRVDSELRDGRNVDILKILSVKLFEVGPVTFPAYKSANTGMKGVNGLREDAAKIEKDRRQVAAVMAKISRHQAKEVEDRWRDIQRQEVEDRIRQIKLDTKLLR